MSWARETLGFGDYIKLTVGNKAPQNLYHFVLDNGVYATTGGQDTPGTNSASYSQLARSAGYAAVFEFDELEDFDNEAEEVLKKPRPVLVCVKTVPELRGLGRLVVQSILKSFQDGRR